MASAFDSLTRELSRLPGLGRRSAERAALELTCKGELAITPLVTALLAVRDQMTTCSHCGGITTREKNPCPLCTDPSRDDSLLLVVEAPGDILTLDRSDAFKGRFHSLNGLISPQQNTAVEDTTIEKLLNRVRTQSVREVILALPTNMEGEATACYIAEKLAAFPDVLVTRLAFGLPADSGVRYSDPLTLRRALAGRQKAIELPE